MDEKRKSEVVWEKAMERKATPGKDAERWGLRIVVSRDTQGEKTTIEASTRSDSLGVPIWERFVDIVHNDHHTPVIETAHALAEAVIDLSGRRPDWDRRGREQH